MHATPPQTHLIDVLADQASAEVDAILSDDIRFRSPYADYAGRADVAHLIGLIRTVLVELTPGASLNGPGVTMSLFEARVADEDVQGVLVEQHDDAGAVVDAMLTLRPYAGLRASMRAMQGLMEDSPLPSAAT
jgi:hypothetical protein